MYDLLSFMDKPEQHKHDNEFTSYLETKCTGANDCIQFWIDNQSSYPKLYRLHLKHHIIPATSASTERAFSVAGLICSDRRNRLDDSVFESLVIAKANSDLL